MHALVEDDHGRLLPAYHAQLLIILLVSLFRELCFGHLQTRASIISGVHAVPAVASQINCETPSGAHICTPNAAFIGLFEASQVSIKVCTCKDQPRPSCIPDLAERFQGWSLNAAQSLGSFAVRAAEACYPRVQTAAVADALQLQVLALLGEGLPPSRNWGKPVLHAEQLPADPSDAASTEQSPAGQAHSRRGLVPCFGWLLRQPADLLLCVEMSSPAKIPHPERQGRLPGQLGQQVWADPLPAAHGACHRAGAGKAEG